MKPKPLFLLKNILSGRHFLVPALLLPVGAWASESVFFGPEPNLATTVLEQVRARDYDVVTKPLTVAEQELVNEEQKSAGKTAKEVDLPKPSQLKYPVSVNVSDKQALEMLEEHLPLIVQQQMNSDISPDQVQFLVEDTPQDAKDMLDTLGYFSAQVNVTPQGNGFQVQVNLGARTMVTSVNVSLAGPILDDEKLGEYYANAMQGWSAQVGTPFLQDTWSSSKGAAVSGIRSNQYPLARMTQSEALITPQETKAELSATINSQQPIYFGDLIIKVNQFKDENGKTLQQKARYPTSIVNRLAKFKNGDPYSSNQIVDFQNALEQDSHYSGVLVTPKLEAEFLNNACLRDNQAPLKSEHEAQLAHCVPVEVTLEEVPRQKFDVGLNFDSVEGYGTRLGYEHYNLLNRGYIGSSFLSYNKYEQSFGLGISQPREVNGTYWTSVLNYKNGTVQRVKTQAWNAGFFYVKERETSEGRLGLEYFRDKSYVENGPDYGTNYATMLTASWRYNRIETTSRPQNGYYLFGKVGSTVGNLLSSASMQMVRADGAYYYTPEDKKKGTFIVRGKVGIVNVSDEMNAPQSLLFRTGGASSVRGYEHESIGISGYQDAVMGGKILSVASLEYLYPIKDNYAFAVFHDMGDVSNKFDEFKIQHGTGIGARWYSPIAPIAFDIAYGHEDQKIRWYVGLGTQF